MSCRLEVHIRQRLERLPICIQQRFDPRAFRNERLVLVQQVSKQLWPVQRRDEPVLDVLRSVIDQKVHDGFGYQVLDCLADDPKVGGDERSDEGRFHFFTRC